MAESFHRPCHLENCPHCGQASIPTHLRSNRFANMPCPCGSGRKFKKCCLIKDTLNKIPPENYHPIPTEIFPRGSDVHIRFCGDSPVVSKRIGDYRVYVPRPDLRAAFKLEILDYISKNIKDGEIRDSRAMRSIFLEVMDFCQASFESSIDKIASLDLCLFLVKNFEQWHLAMEEAKVPGANEPGIDRTFGAMTKKAIAHCLEHYSSYHTHSNKTVPEKHLPYWVERMLISALELVELSEKTTQSAMLLSDECWLIVNHRNNVDPLNVRIPVNLSEKMGTFVENINHSAFNTAIFGYDKFNKYLDDGINDAFLESMGVSWDQIISLNKIFNECASEKSAYGLSMAYENEVYEKFSQELPVTKEQARAAIGAFVLSEDMDNPIELHRTKRPNRLLRRPYIRTKHNGRSILCWSDKVSQRFTLMLSKDMIYGLLPKEWHHKKIVSHIEQVARSIDKEWEEHVYSKLSQSGLFGKMRVKKLVASDGGRTAVSPLAGEIDLLMYDRNLRTLIVGDCKRLKQTWSSHEFIKDKSAFFDGASCFINKIEKKRKWCEENLAAIADSLNFECSHPITIFPIIITEFESAAQVFTDLSICSLGRLMEQIQAGHPPWAQVSGADRP